MENKVSKKGIMFAIISSLESDFIDLFASKLQLEDIPNELLKRSNRETTETNELLSYLRGLDIQAYELFSNNTEEGMIRVELAAQEEEAGMTGDAEKLAQVREKQARFEERLRRRSIEQYIDLWDNPV